MRELKPLNAEVTRTTYFGAKAATYDQDREREEKWRLENEAVEYFLRSSGASGPVVDIPIGTGRFMALYRQLGLAFRGFDVSEEMMRQARAKDAAADIAFGDIMQIPLEDGAAETAVCIRLLNLMTEPEMERALRELARVARKRIILTMRTGAEVGRQNRSWTHRHSEFERIAGAIGFQIADNRLARAPNYRVWHLVRI